MSNSERGITVDKFSTFEDVLRHYYPGATDTDLKVMTWLIETHRELPGRLKGKMHRFMLLMANNNRRAMGLAKRAADGQITFRQLLEII